MWSHCKSAKKDSVTIVFVINCTSASFGLFVWKFSHRRSTYKLIKKLEYFHVQDRLFAMSNKWKYTKNPYVGKKRKAWNKPTKLFPNKWISKLAKSDKGSYYNQGKWINEHNYGKGRYYNEY